jgi:hypothetical protein
MFNNIVLHLDCSHLTEARSRNPILPDQARQDKKAARKLCYKKWKRIANQTAAIVPPIVSVILQTVPNLAVT